MRSALVVATSMPGSDAVEAEAELRSGQPFPPRPMPATASPRTEAIGRPTPQKNPNERSDGMASRQ